jgi:hypothetical protein
LGERERERERESFGQSRRREERESWIQWKAREVGAASRVKKGLEFNKIFCVNATHLAQKKQVTDIITRLYLKDDRKVIKITNFGKKKDLHKNFFVKF